MPDDTRDERDDGAFRHDFQNRPDASPLHHNPPESRVEGANATTDAGKPSAHEQPHKAAPPQDADHHGNTSGEKQQFYERAYWVVTGAASVCATVATVVAAIYAVSAYRATLDTVRETRDQAEAAREANRLSSQALAAAIGSSVHVGHTEFHMFANESGGTSINIMAPIGNDGGTTTRGLRYAAACTDFAVPPIDPFDPIRLDAVRTYNLTLAPKETVKPILCNYSMADWARVNVEHGSVYVYGRATYRDTITPERVHYLEFCTRLYDIMFTASAFNPGPFAHGDECEKHNCTDGECGAG